MRKLPTATRKLRYCDQNYNRRSWMIIQSVESKPPDPKTYIDTALRQYRGLVTDWMLLCYRQAGNPKTLLGHTSLCYEEATRINGLTIMEYFIQEAHKLGMRVHAWFVIYIWAVWNGSTGLLLTDMPDDIDHHIGVCINMANADVRATIVNVIKDFCQKNPGLDGVNLDYIRYDDISGDTAGVTAMVADISAALKGSIELSFCSRCSIGSEITNHQDSNTWIKNGYIQTCLFMDYVSNSENSQELMVTWEKPQNPLRLHGSAMPNSNATLVGKFYTMQQDKRWNFDMFDYQLMDEVAQIKAVDDFISGRTVINQTNVTKISVIHGTSVTFALNGVDKVTPLADMVSHTTNSTVQQHIESVHGEQPLIVFNRPDTDYANHIQICLRELTLDL